jgi:hypothetical protein
LNEAESRPYQRNVGVDLGAQPLERRLPCVAALNERIRMIPE